MAKRNSIDLLVEDLTQRFSQIKNFHLTQEDPMGNKMFNFVTSQAAQFASFRDLFVKTYIPAAIRASQELSVELKNSKYKHLIKLESDVLQENYYETIRLGYVGAYHKYESYTKAVVGMLNHFFQELIAQEKFRPIDKYLKDVFGIELKKTIDKFVASEKVNWISNCVKHYDGYPIKEPVHYMFKHIDRDKKIQISSSEFKDDIENLISQTQMFLQMMFAVGFHQYFTHDVESVKRQLKPEYQDQTEKVDEIIKNYDNAIRGFFSS